MIKIVDNHLLDWTWGILTASSENVLAVLGRIWIWRKGPDSDLDLDPRHFLLQQYWSSIDHANIKLLSINAKKKQDPEVGPYSSPGINTAVVREFSVCFYFLFPFF